MSSIFFDIWITTKFDMKANNISIIPLAKEMKMSPQTIQKFLMRDEDLTLSSILKINSFLTKKEDLEDHSEEELSSCVFFIFLI